MSDARHILILDENSSVPADRRVWQESRALVETGYRVTVICPLGEGQDSSLDETRDGVRILRFPLRPASRGALDYLREYTCALWRMLRLTWTVWRAEPIHVVHACNPPDLLFLIGLPLKALGARFVFDQHDVVPELFRSRFPDGSNTLYRACLALERLTFCGADGVIATNESYRRIAIERGKVSPQRVAVVRNAPDLSRFVPTDPDPLLRRGKKFLAAYVGVMGPQDGVDHAVRALAYLKHEIGRDDLHSIFMGTGDMFDELVDLSKKLSIDDCVEFTGFVSDEFLLRCLSTADVCLSPDPSSPLNNVSTMTKVVEYMAIGRPIVSFELAEARVSAADAAVYAPENDNEAFATLLDELLDDPERRDQMGKVGRARIQGLSWANSSRNLVDFYRQLLAEDRR